jgi:hypothetical protein
MTPFFSQNPEAPHVNGAVQSPFVLQAFLQNFCGEMQPT